MIRRTFKPQLGFESVSIRFGDFVGTKPKLRCQVSGNFNLKFLSRIRIRFLHLLLLDPKNAYNE